MVGPNFHPPQLPCVTTYTPHPQIHKTVTAKTGHNTGKAQYLIPCLDIPGEWWRLYHSPEINQLICLGLQNNPTLDAAEATLKQARETLKAEIGNLFPQVDFSLTGQRERFSGSGIAEESATGIFNNFDASFSVSYTFDFFGGERRAIEALFAAAKFECYQLQAAYLTLTSNIVTTTITIASLKAQIKATYELIYSQERQLQIVKQQFEVGGASRADILTQESQLAETKATLPVLQQSLAQNLHLLSILIGEFPSQNNLPIPDLYNLNLPTTVPLSIPSLLVRHRPDIKAAEALLHQASAEIGVATANLFPQLTLTGNYGWQDSVFANLINPKKVVWNITGQLLQPIFHGGTLLANRRAAIAAYEVACAHYRETVLQGFKNVADALRALQNDARILRDRKNSEIAAHESLVIVEKQFRIGAVNYLNLLIAQRQYQTTRINVIQAEAARFVDTASLFQALGGGWWNKPC